MAVQAVFVEIGRVAIRCRDDHDTGLEQFLEQTAQNHRIGNIGHLHFVEAQEACLRRDLAGDGEKGVCRAFCALVAQVGMDALHEVVEMDPAFAVDRRVGVKEVHHHRFADSDTTIKIDAVGLWFRLCLLAKAEQAARFARRGGVPTLAKAIPEQL